MFPETPLDIEGHKYIFNVKYWFHQNSSSDPRPGRMGGVKIFQYQIKKLEADMESRRHSYISP